MSGAFSIQLTPRQLGAELLVHIARQKLTGKLQHGTAKINILFKDGRAESGTNAEGAAVKDRSGVTGVLRAVAVMGVGALSYKPDNVVVQASLNIDTLGEVLVSVMQLLPSVQLDNVLAARAGWKLETAPSFTKLAGPIAQMGGAPLSAPTAAASFGDLTKSGEPNVARAVLAQVVLGGLKAKEATLSLEMAPVSVLEQEIAAAFAASPQQDHYAFLGVSKDASADTIRKAYFEMAKRWHSDRLNAAGLDDATRRQAEELFRRADEAQRLLVNPDERKNYDWVVERQKQGLPTDARTVLEAENLFRRGETLIRRGQAPAAEPLLRQATEMNKGEAEFWAYLGYAVYATKGAPALAEARDHIAKALGMREKMDVAWEFLGRIAHNEGDLGTAKKHLEKCLELNPKNQYAEREMRLLALRKEQAEKDKKKESAGLLGKLFKR